MSETSPHGYIFDIYFDSESELKKAFLAVEELLFQSEWIFELNLRLHWQVSTLNLTLFKICQEFTEKLRENDKHLNIFFKLPFCLGENSKFATFPNCSECVFFEAGWCLYPRQMGKSYYNVPQKEFTTAMLDQYTRRDFEGSVPLTWYYPKRNQMALAAHQLSQSPTVIDFGSGNGFVTTLFSREIDKPCEIYAIEPNVKVADQMSPISHMRSLPIDIPNDWALFSSLADFYVPLEECLSLPTLPRDIVMIVFPNVFGYGGERREYQIMGGEVVSQNHRALFDFRSLDVLGYRLIHQEKVDSHYFDNTQFLIYSRADRFLVRPERLNILQPYNWESGEKTSRSKNSEISTLDLS